MKKSNIILISILVVLAVSAYLLTKRSGEKSTEITDRAKLAKIDTNQVIY
jgi:Flp pilus assembly protein CpaB